MSRSKTEIIDPFLFLICRLLPPDAAVFFNPQHHFKELEAKARSGQTGQNNITSHRDETLVSRAANAGAYRQVRHINYTVTRLSALKTQ